MQRKETILEELRQVSGFVAGISQAELFEVPQGYFEGLPDKIMERIRTGESGGTELSVTLLNAREQPVYTVPEGYFEGFAAGVLALINVRHAAEPSAGEELSALSPLLSGIGKKTPFQAPEGYFKELLPDMGALLAFNPGNAEPAGLELDMEPLSPLLASLRDKAVYEAPEGYFSGLADIISDRISNEQRMPVPGRVAPVIAPALVISMGRGRNWLRYATAAIVAGLIVTAGWLGYNRTSSQPVLALTDVTWTKVSDQEIQNYLEDQDDHSLTDAGTNSTATLDINDSDVKDLLGDVPDNELKMYLEEHSPSKDVVTN
jgi:hypothetical protein